MKNLTQKLAQVVTIARAAGAEIMDVYAGEFEVETKHDGSPLTQADQRADAIIHAQLQSLDPNIPILSEESPPAVHTQRRKWKRYWLVDPLDGTKGFVKRSGEFTVNIALIEENRAVLGVVYAPVSDVSYCAEIKTAAFKIEGDSTPTPIRTKKFSREKAIMVASRAHAGAKVEAYRVRLADEFGEVEIASMGSSMKICLVAEGVADIYPRLGLTSEWDTAAAHCVLEAAGGRMTNVAGEPLQYNKADILNPWFLAAGDPDFDWCTHARGIK